MGRACAGEGVTGAAASFSADLSGELAGMSGCGLLHMGQGDEVALTLNVLLA